MEATVGALQTSDLSRVLSSCEPELQDLMQQIDIMINHQKREWETQMQAIGYQLQSVKEDLLNSRSVIEQRDLEIKRLHGLLDDVQTSRKELVTKYEQQLQKVCDELDKLKRNYCKLQRKKMKEVTGGEKKEAANLSEVLQLNEKIKEYHQHSIEWEKLCIHHQNQLAEVEVQNKCLMDEITNMKCTSQQQEHRECCSEVKYLRAQLHKAQTSLHSQVLELEHLRSSKTLREGVQKNLQTVCAPFTSLKEGNVPPQSNLELQDCQARHGLAETQGGTELSNPTSKDKFEDALHSHIGVDQPQSAEDREEIQTSKAKTMEWKIQKLFQQLQTTLLSFERNCGNAFSPSSSSGHRKVICRNSTPNMSLSEGQRSSTEVSLSQKIVTTFPKWSLSETSANDMVCHFLEEESLRSKELLQTLDTHIQHMRKSNIRTVSVCLPVYSRPDSVQMSAQ